jgi:hypothetical protein
MCICYIEMASQRIVHTRIGKFRVKVEPRMHIQFGYNISIGGKKDHCIHITTDSTHVGMLHNDKLIRGPATIHMLNLAFTIVKETAPHVTHIHFTDNSSFNCNVSDGQTLGVSIALYELAFHQATWYERHFGAELENPAFRALYIKDGFYRQKPRTFDFNNSTLNAELGPIYERTSTWKEFFDEIYEMNEKCKIILPWYKHALQIIMGNISFEGQPWIIDLHNPKVQNISYRAVVEGGKRSRYMTRRKHKIIDMYADPIIIIYSLSDFKRRNLV